MKRKIRSLLAFLTVIILMGQHAAAQDITAAGGTVTVSHDNNNANENGTKVVDNDYTSKFLLFDFNTKKPIWIQWKANAAAVAGIYTLTSGNDAPGRDPKSWTLEGSNNGTAWTVLDTRTNEAFDQRLLTRTFFFRNATAYVYYRLNISENGGDGLFQLSEWRLLAATAPQAPSDLVALSPSGSEVVLTWKDASNSESGFDVESSTDGSTFALVETVPINTNTFTHTGLNIATKYYYRVTAKNDFGKSAYTNTADATTLNFPEALVDLTNNGGELTVEQENTSNANENSPKFIDNDVNTKYLVSSGNVWIQYVSKDKAILTKYTITSANDADDRDPKDWKLEGSNNGATWTILDTRANEMFPNRFQKKTYIIANTLPFNYYRITIATKGGSAFQAAEWELWGQKLELPAGPSNLTVKALSETAINLTWKDNAQNESGFEIERSADGNTYEVITKVEANITEYNDQNLTAGGGYYYRVAATSIIGNSVYSNVAATRTKGGDQSKPKPVAPAILSPNGDNVNDKWVIQNLDLYPANEVSIFDRAGRLVYSKQDYRNDWDGTYDGSPLAENVYYYIVKFWPGVPDLKGAVMIVRDK